MTKRELIYQKFNGLCSYTGKPLGEDWQIDHIEPQYKFKEGFIEGNKDDIDNLIPALKIVNHYKRGLNLEKFRKYMESFHLRLAKLPKKTTLEKTKKRIAYMSTVANAFDITIDKPFNGKFYFETLN